MAQEVCKFCGRTISTGRYISKVQRSCGECTAYCMRACEKSKAKILSWHYEPCKSCKENPYNKYGKQP